MSNTESAAVTDHRTLPPLTGAGDEEGEAELVETAADLEQLDDAEHATTTEPESE